MNQINLLRYTRQHMRANLRSLIFQWFPGGNIKGGGDDYWVANHVREERSADSFHVNLESGVYYDHGATQVSGKDPLRLYAYHLGFIGLDFSDDFTAMVEAAKHYCSHHGLDVGADVSVPKPIHVPFVRKEPEPKETPLWLIKDITKIWDELSPAAENLLAKAYFENRGLRVPKEARFLESHKFSDGTYPCIVWAYNNKSGELRTLQYVRLFQDDNGKWWHKGRWFHGGCKLRKDSVVRFSAKNLNCKVYAIGEGVETCLSFRALSPASRKKFPDIFEAEVNDMHVWACGNHSNMASVELPSDAEFIYIIGDNDGKGSNAEEYVNQLAARCKAAGVKYKIVRPELPTDKTKWDWNDELMAIIKKKQGKATDSSFKQSQPQETLEEQIKRHFKGARLDKNRCGGKYYTFSTKQEEFVICVEGAAPGCWYNKQRTNSGATLDYLLEYLNSKAS